MKKYKNILKFGIFGGLIFAVCLSFVSDVNAATLFTGSATETVHVGQTFVMEWYLNSGNQSINVVNVGFIFSTSTLRLSEISSAGSGVSLWVKNPTETMTGTVSALGGIPTGVSGTRVPLFRTTFTAIKSGVASFALISGSQTLRSDGAGTNDDLKFNPLSFSVTAAEKQKNIISPTNPDQNKWYKNDTAILKFSIEKNREYSYSFSNNPEIIPPTTSVETVGSVTFNNLADGLYYFKLASRISGDIWQDEGLYRVQIDSVGPEKFSPIVSNDSGVASGKNFVSFSTTDKISGIKSYKIKIGLFDLYHTATSPYVFGRPWVGDGISMKAIDTAGETTYVYTAYPGYVSTKVFLLLLLIILVIAGVVYNKRHIRS